MSNFFELSESKKKSLTLKEISEQAERLEINIHKKSEKTGKNVKKTKQDLLDEIDSIYIENKIEKISEKNEEKKLIKSENKCKIIIELWLSDTDIDKLSNDKEFKNNMFKIEFIEKTYNVNLGFGSILYYGDFYLINKDKSFILLDKIKDNFVNIPRIITKNLNNPINHFSKLTDERIKIGSIELNNNDDFIFDYFNIDKFTCVGINFNYVYIFDLEKHLIQIELNYLSQNSKINEKFETFKFFPKKDISSLQLFDFHHKLSNNKFPFIFKIYGPPGHIIHQFIDGKTFNKNLDGFMEWKDNISIEKTEINKGNIEKNIDSFYECSGYTTMYAKFENIKNINKLCFNELNIEDIDISYMIKDKDYLKFSDDSFTKCIEYLGADIIDFNVKNNT